MNNINVQEIIFFILSIITITSALAVIFSNNPIHSLLALIITFFSISGHYIFLNAQFLAIVNIIVYAGAIMVLFLFVIMLMNLNKETEPQKKQIVKILGTICGGILFLVIIFVLLKTQTSKEKIIPLIGEIGLVKNLGLELFKKFVIPFELTGLLFLTAIIGTVILSKKETKKIN